MCCGLRHQLLDSGDAQQPRYTAIQRACRRRITASVGERQRAYEERRDGGTHLPAEFWKRPSQSGPGLLMYC